MTKTRMDLMSCFCWSKFVISLMPVGLMIALPINVNALNDRRIDKLAIECQSGNAKSCQKLAEIAKNDKKWTVRLAAVEKLTDLAILAEIAKTDEDRDVRKSAVAKITDQSLLAEIAKTDEESDVRQAAMEKLVDQKLIVEIAKTDESKNVRKNAVKMITDQVLLSELANSDKDMNREAFIKIWDQNCIFDVGKNASDVEIREDATEKLKDPKMIAEVVIKEPDWHAKFQALLIIKDEALLAFVAKERLPTSVDIERGELELLPGETVQTEIRTGVVMDVYVNRSIQDEIVTSKITIKPGSIEFEGKTIRDIPTFAAELLADQSLIADVAINAFRSSVRRVAVKKLTDKTLLGIIAETDKDGDVRKAAQMRMEELQEK